VRLKDLAPQSRNAEAKRRYAICAGPKCSFRPKCNQTSHESQLVSEAPTSNCGDNIATTLLLVHCCWTHTVRSSHTNSGSAMSTSPPARKRNFRKCIIGVCAMDKKVKSQPMIEILDRLRAYGEFEVIVFGNNLILDENVPVEEWPICDCLISFWSSKFPIERAVKYVELRKPFCVNDLPSQQVFRSRPAVYDILDANGIPTPRHLFVDRTSASAPSVSQTPDYIEIGNQRMNFPIVEKPYEADNHDVYIYYGGNQGSRRLFRKIGDRSSQMYPDVNELRTDGSFVYEEFMKNGKVRASLHNH